MLRTGVLSMGSVIALARKEAGLSQRDLAEQLGLSYRSVQEYEGDRTSPMPHLNEIERVTGKPQGWILDHVDPYRKIIEMSSDIEEIKDSIRDILGLLRQR